MDSQARGIPDDYQQQMQRLDQQNKPLVMVIDGVKTIAMKRGKFPKETYKPYVEVAERLRILHERIKNKEIQRYEMLVSEPSEIQGRVWWQVRVFINESVFIGSSEVHLKGTPGSADEKDCFANAETSALGRALGAAGLGTIDGLASYDEMRQADYSANPPRESRTVDEEPSPEIKAIMIQELEQKCTKLYGVDKFETVKKRLGITALNAAMSMADIEKIDKALAAREKAQVKDHE